jgi:hypothetical protein
VTARLRVECSAAGEGWSCAVTVEENGSHTGHEVRVTRAELARFAPGSSEPSVLVEQSFRFLLEREPKESILRRFAISDIGRYFPDYATVIRDAQ